MFDIQSLIDPVALAQPLRLEKGVCAALSGASGSGKSRFLRALADLDPNDADISLNGVSRAQLTGPDWRRRVTYVAAESGWWAERVRDHFDVSDLDAARGLLPALDLPSEAVDWEVMRLSTGERQRLALLRALVQEPDVLLLDEPTAPLDKRATDKVERLLADHLARGAVLLLVTHDPAQATRLAGHFLEVAGLKVQEVHS